MYCPEALYAGDGSLRVRYIYDSWGNTLSVQDGNGQEITSENDIGNLNPFRYRGYYFDSDTGLYYLQNRYYDPQTCRFVNADGVVPATGNSVQGYNLFVYCMNNPVNMIDSAGNWPQFIENAVDWVNNNIVQPVKKFINDIVDDVKNYDINNESEEKVFSSNYFCKYKGTLVIKTPFDASFSFGFIGLSKKQQSSETLNHEYGHTLQFKNMGIVNYTTDVAVPSITINLLDRLGKLKYDYYGAPWESEADLLGGVNRQYFNKPWPEDAYTSYYDLIKMFWE